VPGYLEAGDISFFYNDLDDPQGLHIQWTAATDGTVQIAGSIWAGNPAQESQLSWALSRNGTALSGGLGNSVLRSSPTDFALGAGASGLENIVVQAGDHLDLFLIHFSGGNAIYGINFTVTLTSNDVDPVAAIEDLAVTVFDMNLQNGIENSLDSKLDAALAALEDANVNNDGAACNSLSAFISAVEAQRNKKITNAQADQLIASAQEIRSMLGCPN
jgi:hypothetical protein